MADKSWSLVSSTPPSRKSPVYSEQVSFFTRLLDDLVQAHRTGSSRPFRDWPEYMRVLQGAYACGFVCRDIDLEIAHSIYQKLLLEPALISAASFSDIRNFVHLMMRAERHADGGHEEAGGSVIAALRSGALEAIAHRLRSRPYVS